MSKECRFCGESYSNEELQELKEMGEEFCRKPFICPDCWDGFQRLDLEDQEKALFSMEGRDER